MTNQVVPILTRLSFQYDDTKDDQINVPYRLLTSAAVPAFDKKSNRNNQTRVAKLLGVAGTDVPIDEIEKLTLPYKVSNIVFVKVGLSLLKL